MAHYQYQARSGSGEMVTGVLEAANVDEAGRQLRSDGQFVVKITEALGGEESREISSKVDYRRIKSEEVIHFAHHMSIMIDTGVSIGEALDMSTEQSTGENFRKVLSMVSDEVQGGSTFSKALSRHRRVFPNLMVSLIRASEASGTMGEMLGRVSDYLGQERNTRKSVRGAMMYPCVMMVVCLVVTLFLMVFVLPKFSQIYVNRGATLPMPTQVLLTVSEITMNYWYMWLGLLVGAVVVVLYLRRKPLGSRCIDYMKLHTPIIGEMFNQLYLMRAMRTMGTLVTSGVPMLDMIEITREVTDNSYYHDLWEQVDAQLRGGSQLSTAMFDSPIVPTSIARMIHSGERAGRLGPVLERIAKFTEMELEDSIRRTTQFIEPAMVVIMGSVIGFIAISLLLPIFTVGRVMAG